MTTTHHGYTCSCCEQVHGGLPPAVGFDAPAFWWDHMVGTPGHRLTSDTCVIPDVGLFVRAVLPIHVVDADQDFEWGVWVSQSQASFQQLTASPGDRTTTFGWLSTDLPGYEPSTLELATTVRPQGRELRPLLEVEPSEHPLSIEQRNGITVARVRELSAPFLPED